MTIRDNMSRPRHPTSRLRLPARESGMIRADEAHTYRSQVKPQSVLGSCVAWQVDHGLPILWAGDARIAARFVERMLVRVHRANIHAAELVPLRKLRRAATEDGPNAA